MYDKEFEEDARAQERRKMSTQPFSKGAGEEACDAPHQPTRSRATGYHERLRAVIAAAGDPSSTSYRVAPHRVRHEKDGRWLPEQPHFDDPGLLAVLPLSENLFRALAAADLDYVQEVQGYTQIQLRDVLGKDLSRELLNALRALDRAPERGRREYPLLGSSDPWDQVRP